VSRRDFYTFNTSIAGIEEADAILLVGTNPRTEAPLVNARIRKRWLAGGLTVAAIGPELDLTYPAQMLGNAPALLAGLRDGSHPFAGVLKGAKKPMLILGAGALARPDGAAILAACWALAAGSHMLTPEWHGFNVLHHAASRVGGLALHAVPAQMPGRVGGAASIKQRSITENKA
jgi:NADH-quinone oxidoreductase subunit G